MTTKELLSPLRLAERLGSEYLPTDEQQQVIASELAPVLVVAGAGSGKTSTMADRVVWLLANGLAEPEEILGLTFTRKAATELQQRIRLSLEAAHRAGMIAQPDEFALPTVATYNGFAHSLFVEHSSLIGREAEAQVLDESSAWGLMRQVVLERGSAAMAAAFSGIDQLTTVALKFSRALSENQADLQKLSKFPAEFATVLDLPGHGGRSYKAVEDAVAAVARIPDLMVLAQGYEQLKKERNLIEFSDQIALALSALHSSEEVTARIRSRYRQVILDEYQDTSVLQTRLLSTLFAQGAVMAVGDPHQSIYGWRGASASNLAGFFQDFQADQPRQYSLSISWRNDVRILGAANTIAAPLKTSSRVSVDELRSRPGAGEGAVSGVFVQDIVAEAEAAAAWAAEKLAASGETLPSIAMLFRKRSQMHLFAEKLSEAGVPAQVLGLGGLLSTPEVTDVMAALKVVADPDAGNELIRLLSGGRWRIGAADLLALRQIASWLSSLGRAAITDDDALRMFPELSVSLVDALDFLDVRGGKHPQFSRLSAAGLERMTEAAAVFSELRRNAVSFQLPELVLETQRALRLDLEAEANPGSLAAENLLAFVAEVQSLSQRHPESGLPELIRWYDRALNRDDLDEAAVQPAPGMVQLLTVHAAKGLEWDFTVIPTLTGGSFPTSSREGTGWLRTGELPYEFRGDSADLERLEWRGLKTQKELRDRIDDFQTALQLGHLEEERRLFYVALTRARHEVLLTASFWAQGKRPREASLFWQELAAADFLPEPPELEHSENPLLSVPRTLAWPLDPLGGRREEVDQAAALVRTVMAARQLNSAPEHDFLSAGRWAGQIELLLAERDRQPIPPALPVRIPASRFKDYLADPETQLESLLRPLPQQPFSQALLGNIFHSWVELRASDIGSLQPFDFDALEPSDDDDNEPSFDPELLRRYQETFERSRWGGRRPWLIEKEIHLPFLGHLIICKLDAVYRSETGYEIVDWKTGQMPRGAKEIAERSLQLALYRLAFAEYYRIPLEEVSACFYYVAEDSVLSPDTLPSRNDLEGLWRNQVQRRLREGSSASPLEESPRQQH